MTKDYEFVPRDEDGRGGFAIRRNPPFGTPFEPFCMPCMLGPDRLVIALDHEFGESYSCPECGYAVLSWAVI